MPQQRVRWFPAWLYGLGWVMAVLLPQMLGLLHGVTHNVTRAVTARSIHGSARPFMAQVDQPRTARSPLAIFFSSHNEGTPDCRLYDQASHDGVAATVVVLDLPLFPPSTAVGSFAGDALARWAAQFDARGPPLTS